MLDSPRKIQHGQQAEDECLDEPGKQPEKHHGQRCQVQPHQEEEDAKHQFFAEDIAEQTDGEAEDTGKVPNEFNGENEGDQPSDRAHEVLDVFGSVKLHANDMGEHHHNDGTGTRGIKTGRGGKETRDHPHIVAGQNKEP